MTMQTDADLPYYLAKNESFGVAPAVIANLTRLCGADYVQVGSFTGSVYDAPDDVRAQIDACRRSSDGVNRAVAVIGGGVGPENAEAQLRAAGTAAGTMLLLGSAAYANGSPEASVRAVRAVADRYS